MFPGINRPRRRGRECGARGRWDRTELPRLQRPPPTSATIFSIPPLTPHLVGSFVCLSISVASHSKVRVWGGLCLLIPPPPQEIIFEVEGGVRGRGVGAGRGEPGGCKMFDFFIFLSFLFAGEGEDEESSAGTGGGTGCLEDVANH